MTHIRFGPLARPVAFEGGGEILLEPLGRFTAGWTGSPAAEDDGEAPLVTVRRARGRFRIDAPWLDAPVVEDDPFRAAANLAVDLAEAYLAEHPDMLAIHCAAAAFGERLVVFPGRSRAGKSLLSARLAAGGHAVFADDLLLLTGPDDGIGKSIGIAPRLRLPLPRGLSPAFRAFLDAHRGPGDEDYRYVALPDGLAPRFGRAAPLGAVVLLAREEGSRAALEPAGQADGVEALLLQNLSPRIRTADAVGRAARLVAALPCFVLRYADLDEAAALLLGRFGDWNCVAPPARSGRDGGAPARPAYDGSAEPRYRMAPGVRVEQVEDARFLVSTAGEVYRLDPLSSGLWALLEEPTGVGEATAILQGAFPDTDPERIAHDVRRFFAALRERGLIA